MKIIRSVVLALVGVLLFNPATIVALQAQNSLFKLENSYRSSIRFERLTVEDGLPHATVLSVLQDQQGFMWFTTQDGLSRYDGTSFTTFLHDANNPNSLSNNNTFALIESQDGLIWVGTDPGGLNVYDPNTGKFSLYLHDPENPNSLADNSIWSLLEDQDGSIWVGTRNGLSHLDRETGIFKNYLPDSENPRALAAPVVYHLYQDKAGTVWVGTRLGLQRYDPESDDFTIFQNNPDNPDSLSNNNIWGMLEDSQGNFWIATRGGGLNLFDRSSNTFTAYEHDPNDPASISDNRLWKIYEDHLDNLWITTENGGLNLFDRETQKFTSFQHNPNDPFTISNNDTFWMTEDRSGVLWITSRYGGVNKLYPSLSRFGLYRSVANNPNSLSINSVYSILAEKNGIIWIGTFGGGLNRLDRKTGRMTVFKNNPEDPTSLSNDKIYYIFRDESGVLWLATSGGGLNRMDPFTREFTTYRYSSEAPNVIGSGFLTTLESAGDGRLWVGTLGYGLDLFNTKTGEMDAEYFHDPENPDSLSEDTIYDLAVDATGKVWIATARGGLELFDPVTGIFTHHMRDFNNPNSILDNLVHAIYLDEKNGIVWAGTAGGLSGLEIASGQWQNYTTRDGLPNNTIVGIQPGSNNDLWISTSKGICNFKPVTNTFHNYDVRDGLQGDQFGIASSHLGPDGEIFFGGSNGLTFFHPDTLAYNEHLPQIVFTDFQLFNKTVPAGSELLPQPIEKTSKLVLTHDQTVFTLSFAALNYQISSKNLYQYKMDGFDKDWSPPLTKREATYTNLSPGTYTFMVRASNNDGKWNVTPAKIVIEILPPWWGTWWFRILAVLSAIFLVLGGVQLRIRNINKINRELEKRVNGRTKELQDAQDRLHLANDELKRQLEEITKLEKQVREQAIRDALTGLYNRHHLSEVLDIEFSYAKRKKHSIAFMLMDLDHFKNINDVYGHQAGDQALKAATTVIREQIRRSDVAFRYGGEEFLVILPEITLEDGVYRAEQLCQDINALEIPFEGEMIHINASIGVAFYPQHGNTDDEILSRVDKALYQAKATGRNKVVLYAPENE
ncbi:MAG: diguanylate cyclase [Anaerolineales bacterium]|nr:diguanylate cyclase [Anaerolineales bacterium]